MRDRFLLWLVHMSTHRRKTVFTVSILLTVFFGALSSNLTLDMRWTTLLPESLPVVREYKKINEHYLQPGNMIVAISGPDQIKLAEITDEVTSLLTREMVAPEGMTEEECIVSKRYARYVYGKLPEEWLEQYALSLAKPKDAKRIADIFRDPRLLPYLIHLNDDFESEYSDSENVKNQERQIVSSLDAVQQLAAALGTAAEAEVPQEDVDRIIRDLTIGKPYQYSLDNTMSLIMVASSISSLNFGELPNIDRRVEELLAPFVDRYPGYRFERTGMTAIGRDELDSMGVQTSLISLSALVIVYLLLVWYFGSFLTPVLALVPIVTGIIWSMGIIAVFPGQMNIITSMIMVVLLGLGIDFTIHLASRFHEENASGQSFEVALYRSIAETGKGVMTGAVTTAIAFYALMIADTKGVSEFGFCAGTGVMVTLFSTMFLLPSLLALRYNKGASEQKPMIEKSFTVFSNVLIRFKMPVIAVCLIVTVAGLLVVNKIDWEWNFLNLEPEGLRSVELQDEIIDKYKLSVSMSMFTTDTVEESRKLRKELKTKGLVGDVDDISLWTSRPDYDESLVHIARLRRSIEKEHEAIRFADGSEPSGDDEFSSLSLEDRRFMIADEIDRLWANIVEIQALSITGGQDRVVEKTRQLVSERATRDTGLLRCVADRYIAGDVNWSMLDKFAVDFEEITGARMKIMAQNEIPVTIDMIPEDIRARYTSDTSESYLSLIYPRKNLFEREELELFQDVVTKVHPNVTGLPQLMLNMNKSTLEDGKKASLFALLVIITVLFIDFRRPLPVLLSLLPLFCGMAVTFLIMYLFGEKINYVNMIGLPVIIGIGVDDGVHFLHRYIQDGQGKIAGPLASVGRAMLMTSLTTMTGFGSMMFYLMRGMASLGFVLFVGVGLCFIITITLLPSLVAALKYHNNQSVDKENNMNASNKANFPGVAKSFFLILFLCLTVSWTSPSAEETLSVKEIMEQCDIAEGYESSYAEIKQIITTSGGALRTLQVRSWAVRNGEKQLAEYLAPADIKGQKILMTGDGDNIWMFNPETRRTRKLGSHMKKKKVMGSDFTYEDQAGGKLSEKYTGTHLKNESVGDADCYVLELKPTPKGPSYDKIIAWIDAERFVSRRVDYYQNGEEEPFKRLTMSDFKEVDEKFVAHSAAMKNLEDRTETSNVIISIRFGASIPESIFESRSLSR